MKAEDGFERVSKDKQFSFIITDNMVEHSEYYPCKASALLLCTL